VGAVGQWWAKFGWILVVIPFLHIGLLKLGVTIPLAIVFAVSGLAMVVLVTELSRRGLIARQHLVGGLTIGVIVLNGLAGVEAMSGSAVLLGGMCLFMAINIDSAGSAILGDRKTRRQTFCVVMIPMGLMLGFLFQSLWRPVTTESVQHYVADFTTAPYADASWRHWMGPVRWLKDKGLEADTSGAKQLAQDQLTGEQNVFVLNYAQELGLITGDEAPIVPHFDSTQRQLFDESYAGKPFHFLFSYEYVVRKLLSEGRSTPPQLDTVSDRLLATLREERQSERVQREEVRSILGLTKLIDRPVDAAEFQAPIHELLLKMQKLNKSTYQKRGGFRSHQTVDSCDDHATLAAIELMEDWGVPLGIDVLALRSYLRPSYQDRGLIGTDQRLLPGIRPGAAQHFVGRQRLNDMPEIPAVTVWDYLRYERNLIMSMLLMSLALYAVLVAPNSTASDGN